MWNNLTAKITEYYSQLQTNTSPEIFSVLEVLLFILLITLVSIFIYYFYLSISKRSIITLNLRQYNRTLHPFWNKMLASFLFFVEYLLLMPFLILLWFAALSIIILLIADEKTASQVLFVSAGLIGAVRILAYFHQEIAKDLAKLFPFIMLSVFILSPNSFFPSKIMEKIFEIPSLFPKAIFFLGIVVAVEIILRIFHTAAEFFYSSEK